MRRSRLSLMSVAFGTALALAIPSSAVAAATPLTPDQWVVVTGVQPDKTDYPATTTAPYWSAVVLNPGYQTGPGGDIEQDYNLSAYDAKGNFLALSKEGVGKIDYVAMDTNKVAKQPYTMRVEKFHATSRQEQYRLVFANGNATIAPGRRNPLTVPPGSQQRNNVYVRDFYLNATATATVFVGGDNVTCPPTIGTLYLNAFILGTTAASPSVQARGSHLAWGSIPEQRGTACGVTLAYTAKEAGWYGLLIIDPLYPQPFVDLTIS